MRPVIPGMSGRRRASFAVAEDCVVALCLGLAVGMIASSPLLGLAIFVGQLAPTFFTHFRTSEMGIHVRNVLSAYVIEWADVNHVCVRRGCTAVGRPDRLATVHTRQGIRLPVKALQRPYLIFRTRGLKEVDSIVSELNRSASSAT